MLCDMNHLPCELVTSSHSIKAQVDNLVTSFGATAWRRRSVVVHVWNGEWQER